MLLKILGLCFIVWMSCSSQKKSALFKAHSYYQVKLPGIVKRGEEKFVPDTFPVVFIELQGQLPEFTMLWYKKRTYSVKPVLVEKLPHTVGTSAATGLKIEIKPGEGRSLYFLVLTKLTSALPAPVPVNDEIILEGQSGGNTFHRVINAPLQLSTPGFQ